MDGDNSKTLRYFDTHAHPHFKDFDEDRDAVMHRVEEANIGVIAVGTDLRTSVQVVSLAHRYEHVYACIGVHPNTQEDFVLDDYKGLIKDKKVVAIGECGLDYFRNDMHFSAEKKRQKDMFEQHIDCAVRYKKTLMMHIRSSKGSSDAHDDALAILKSKKREYGDALKLHAHFFTMGVALARQFLELDSTIAFPGVVTFAKETHDTVRYVPLTHILSETDAPYAAPTPQRGRRNEPYFVRDIAASIADIRGEEREVVRAQLVENARRTFLL